MAQSLCYIVITIAMIIPKVVEDELIQIHMQTIVEVCMCQYACLYLNKFVRVFTTHTDGELRSCSYAEDQ